MSLLDLIGGLGAIGRHDSNLKTDLDLLRGCRRHRHIGPCAAPAVRAPKSYANSPKENTMKRRATLATATAALLCFAADPRDRRRIERPRAGLGAPLLPGPVLGHRTIPRDAVVTAE
jgi:hypothetical protein